VEVSGTITSLALLEEVALLDNEQNNEVNLDHHA